MPRKRVTTRRTKKQGGRRRRGARSTMFEPRSPTGKHGGAALDDAKFASQSAERNQPRSSWAERPPRRRYCYGGPLICPERQAGGWTLRITPCEIGRAHV